MTPKPICAWGIFDIRSPNSPAVTVMFHPLRYAEPSERQNKGLGEDFHISGHRRHQNEVFVDTSVTAPFQISTRGQSPETPVNRTSVEVSMPLDIPYIVFPLYRYILYKGNTKRA